MANGYWIKMRVSLPSDPRVIEMASHLSTNEYFMSWIAEPARMTCKETALEIVTPTVTRSVTVTGLLLVWGVASECGKRDGECDMRLDYANLYTIDEISGVPGFGEAMESVGWITQRDKHLIFPNFCEDNVIHEDRATAQARERKRKQRERQKAERDIKRDSHAKSHVREEESREEKIREKNKDIKDISPTANLIAKGKPPDDAERVPIPDELDTEAFRSAWSDWIADRRDRKKKMTVRAATLQLSKLLELGHDRAIAAIEYSIANGYQGIFEPRGSGGNADGSAKGNQGGAAQRRIEQRAREFEEPALQVPRL